MSISTVIPLNLRLGPSGGATSSRQLRTTNKITCTLEQHVREFEKKLDQPMPPHPSRWLRDTNEKIQGDCGPWAVLQAVRFIARRYNCVFDENLIPKTVTDIRVLLDGLLKFSDLFEEDFDPMNYTAKQHQYLFSSMKGSYRKRKANESEAQHKNRLSRSILFTEEKPGWVKDGVSGPIWFTMLAMFHTLRVTLEKICFTDLTDRSSRTQRATIRNIQTRVPTLSYILCVHWRRYQSYCEKP